MTTALNDTQRQTLKLFREHNLGAIRVPGTGWVFPEDIRNDARLSESVIQQLTLCARCGKEPGKYRHSRGLICGSCHDFLNAEHSHYDRLSQDGSC